MVILGGYSNVMKAIQSMEGWDLESVGSIANIVWQTVFGQSVAVTDRIANPNPSDPNPNLPWTE